MRSRDLPAAVLLALAVALAVVGTWAAFARSLIPIAVDGEVTHHEVKHEKHPGVDDVYLVRIDSGRQLVVDREVGRAIRAGDVVSKHRWSTTLTTPRGEVALAASRDANAMVLVLPAAVVATALLVRFGNRRAEPRHLAP